MYHHQFRWIVVVAVLLGAVCTSNSQRLLIAGDDARIVIADNKQGDNAYIIKKNENHSLVLEGDLSVGGDITFGGEAEQLHALRYPAFGFAQSCQMEILVGAKPVRKHGGPVFLCHGGDEAVGNLIRYNMSLRAGDYDGFISFETSTDRGTCDVRVDDVTVLETVNTYSATVSVLMFDFHVSLNYSGVHHIYLETVIGDALATNDWIIPGTLSLTRRM